MNNRESNPIDELMEAITKAARRPTPMQLLAAYILASLKSLQITQDEDFTRRLNLDPESVELLLVGELPEWEITDDLLRNIADVIQCSPNLLRGMIGHTLVSGEGLFDEKSEVARKQR